jgi:ABC-type glycerol-3-phosphate transport system substrate-binding protein
MFLSLLWQNEGEPYAADDGSATFDSDAGVKALTWMQNMVTRGYSPDNVAADSQYVAFKDKKLAFSWHGIWQINDLTVYVLFSPEAQTLPAGLSTLQSANNVRYGRVTLRTQGLAAPRPQVPLCPVVTVPG